MLSTVLSHALYERFRIFLWATFLSSTAAFNDAFDAILQGVGHDQFSPPCHHSSG
jgi:hypothetical protein